MRGNVFEHQVVQLSGEAFLEEVALCGLQPGALPELRLPDTQLGEPVEGVFTMRNASAKHFRCWPTSCLGTTQPSLETPAVNFVLSFAQQTLWPTWSAKCSRDLEAAAQTWHALAGSPGPARRGWRLRLRRGTCRRVRRWL